MVKYVGKLSKLDIDMDTIHYITDEAGNIIGVNRVYPYEESTILKILNEINERIMKNSNPYVAAAYIDSRDIVKRHLKELYKKGGW